MKRPNWLQVSAEGAKAVGALHHYVTKGTALPEEFMVTTYGRVSV